MFCLHWNVNERETCTGEIESRIISYNDFDVVLICIGFALRFASKFISSGWMFILFLWFRDNWTIQHDLSFDSSHSALSISLSFSSVLSHPELEHYRLRKVCHVCFSLFSHKIFSHLEPQIADNCLIPFRLGASIFLICLCFTDHFVCLQSSNESFVLRSKIFQITFDRSEVKKFWHEVRGMRSLHSFWLKSIIRRPLPTQSSHHEFMSEKTLFISSVQRCIRADCEKKMAQPMLSIVLRSVLGPSIYFFLFFIYLILCS